MKNTARLWRAVFFIWYIRTNAPTHNSLRRKLLLFSFHGAHYLYSAPLPLYLYARGLCWSRDISRWPYRSYFLPILAATCRPLWCTTAHAHFRDYRNDHPGRPCRSAEWYRRSNLHHHRNSDTAFHFLPTRFTPRGGRRRERHGGPRTHDLSYRLESRSPRRSASSWGTLG